jgi:hypothetical protein
MHHEELYWTVTVDEPLFPSAVAVIVTGPGVAVNARVTSPVLLTVARRILPDDHVTVRPVKTIPFASFNVAVSWMVF